MEKGPETRIVGSASEEKKEQVKKEIRQIFFNHFESLSAQEQEQLKKLEYSKSDKELALIDFANKETSQLMREAEIEPYDVPAENLHIVPTELYKKIGGGFGNAVTFQAKKGIFFDAQYFKDNPVYFGLAALHEILHLKAHFSVEAEEEGEKVKKTQYRGGICVSSSQRHSYNGKYHLHFKGLDEAIVTEAEKRLLGKLLYHPELAKEKEWLASDRVKEVRKKIATEKEIPEDEFFWISKITEKGECDWITFPYFQQRKVLNYICAEIKKQFPDQYQSVDDIYRVFLNANFTGKLLKLGRLVDKTFGDGSFRLLGNMNADDESGILHFESLKKARARQIKILPR